MSDDSEDEPIMSWIEVADTHTMKNQENKQAFDEDPAARTKPDADDDTDKSFFFTPHRAPAPPSLKSSSRQNRPKLPLPDGWRLITNTMGKVRV